MIIISMSLCPDMPFKKYPNIMDKYRQSICRRRVSDNYLMNHEYSSSPLIALHIPDESSPALSDLSRKLSMYEDLFAPVRRLYIFHIESSFSSGLLPKLLSE